MITFNEVALAFVVQIPVTAAAIARARRSDRESVMAGYSRVPRFRQAIAARVTHNAPASCCLHTACSEECARTQASQHQTRYLLGAVEALRDPDAARNLINNVTKKKVYDVPDLDVTSILAGRKTGT